MQENGEKNAIFSLEAIKEIRHLCSMGTQVGTPIAERACLVLSVKWMRFAMCKSHLSLSLKIDCWVLGTAVKRLSKYGFSRARALFNFKFYQLNT